MKTVFLTYGERASTQKKGSGDAKPLWHAHMQQPARFI